MYCFKRGFAVDSEKTKLATEPDAARTAAQRRRRQRPGSHGRVRDADPDADSLALALEL
jgi:hypothetical protein